jgi:hypothetical protein
VTLVYLSGCAAYSRLEAQVAKGIGLMLTPLAGYRPAWIERVPAWAADTGCFKQGDAFDLGRYFDWLDRMGGRDTCLFATAPDVVGNAGATWERSAPVLPELRQRGWRAALVGQDGMERAPVLWSEFDAFFIGGSTEWKLSRAAADLAREAKARGKFVHMGRVNSGKRLLYAKRIGCDSADGTYMAYNPSEAISRMGRWLARANAPQLPLF